MNNDKRVIVTGASRGIGAAVAKQLAVKGYTVGVNYQKNKKLAESVLHEINKTAEQTGASGYLIPFDISDRDETTKVLEKDLEDKGTPWGVVLNAGIARDALFPALEDDMWDAVINTNLNGFYNVLKPLVMPMARARKGRIVALSSISGVTGNRGQVNYSAAKAGIIGAVRSLAMELAKRKVTVNTVAPGIIDTEMAKNLKEDEIVKMIPMRRYGTPQEVAYAVDFLLSENASYITGQVISVNGGMA